MFDRYYIGLLFIVCILSSCTSSVREAKDVVAQADSLWQAGQMYGVDEGDSATLAQAYETLRNYNLSPLTFHLSSSYAHSCYHYGRLLRAKDNPVEAMQVFIEATHSHTRDYHILGRVYSNMGSICHLAGEFPLSYDMYERSADMFLHNGDTIAYFYALNDMAFELAEQGKKEETLSLLTKIEDGCSDTTVLNRTLETKAEACLYTQQYDSVLYYTDILYSNNSSAPSTVLLRAKAFSFLNQKDSAVHYANYVLSISKEIFNENSALYILTHDDESKDRQAIRKTSADRSDVQKLIKIQQGKLSQAVQLLEQDINRKPDLRWLMAIIGTLLAIGCIIGFYVYKKRKKQALLAQKIEVLEQTANTIQEKKDELAERYQTNHKQIEDEINSRCSMLRTNESIKKNLAWKNYKKMCQIVDQRFYFLASKLRDNHFLNEAEVRLCILTLLDCEYDRIAELLYHAPTSIGTLKMRVAKKLGTTAKNLRQYLIDNECVS